MAGKLQFSCFLIFFQFTFLLLVFDNEFYKTRIDDTELHCLSDLGYTNYFPSRNDIVFLAMYHAIQPFTVLRHRGSRSLVFRKQRSLGGVRVKSKATFQISRFLLSGDIHPNPGP